MEIRTRKKNTKKKWLALSAGSAALMILLAVSGSEMMRNTQGFIRERVLNRFRVHTVEWMEIGSGNLSAKVTVDNLRQVSGLKINQPLFDTKLEDLEKRLLTIPWLESVQIQTKLTSGLTIQYKTHQARAIVTKDLKPWLVSTTGHWIAPLEMAGASFSDLPFISGFENVGESLDWLSNFEQSLNGLASIHEISYKTEIKALIEIFYTSQSLKVWVNLGEPVSITGSNHFARLKKVVQYLIKNNILISSVDLRAGQKIVVNVGKRL